MCWFELVKIAAVQPAWADLQVFGFRDAKDVGLVDVDDRVFQLRPITPVVLSRFTGDLHVAHSCMLSKAADVISLQHNGE